MNLTMTASAVLCVMATAATAADPTTCLTVRLAEPGWNDLALTTGTAAVILEALGYKAESSILGIPVIYQSLAKKDLDVFLGYWDPAMQTYASPYEADGSVERIHVNLVGAKYTFGVPDYVYDAGVHDFADLHIFADQFDHKMYGIEAGSNQLMFDAIANKSFDLAGWEVVESSESGMLAEVERKIEQKQFIVFQAWAPHPMNTKFPIHYLTGGDAQYGPNLGAATVSTQVRKGYLQECPNVAALLNNLTFDLDFENKGMGYLIDDGMDPRDAARKILQENPQVLDAWLKSVTTVDGKPGLDAVKAALQ